MTNGKNYNTTVWVRSQSGTPSAKATLPVTANGTTYYVQLIPAAGVNANDWTLLTGTATVSWSGTLSSATFYVETAAGTDRLLVDDASSRVTRVPEPCAHGSGA
ncbi:carbohydrate binding domain-containing protein [Micromonospora sp. NPDC005413]|uniref:carbohydrate binding domain-containing protein n=1 Tax=Micromonospora sp. NPDC005413 TaxID=3154563 RepID=UPI0033AEED12